MGLKRVLVHIELGESEEMIVLLGAGNGELHAPGLVGDDIRCLLGQIFQEIIRLPGGGFNNDD